MIEHHLESPYWRISPARDVIVDIDAGDHERNYTGPLAEYLNHFPPLVVLSSGASIRQGVLFKPKIQNQRLDFDVIVAKDWADTDITKEADPPSHPFIWNVQTKTTEIIRNEFNLGADDFLICDDRANEVADLVLVQGGLRRKITLFHCKYKKIDKKQTEKKQNGKKAAEPGLNKKDLTELADQGMRSGYWVNAPNLLQRLLSRMTGKLSYLLHGKEDDLKTLATKFAPDEWNYAVTLVQPGFTRKDLVKSAKPSQTEQLLIVLWDRITTEYGAAFSIWIND